MEAIPVEGTAVGATLVDTLAVGILEVAILEVAILKVRTSEEAKVLEAISTLEGKLPMHEHRVLQEDTSFIGSTWLGMHRQGRRKS